MGVVPGCRSTPVKPAGVEAFDKAIEIVPKAVNALIVTGFDVERSEPHYVEGSRPRRVGLVVGLCGETVGT